MSFSRFSEDEVLTELSKQFGSFLESSVRNIRLYVGPLTAYVRKSVRWLSLEGKETSKRWHCLDIASIEVDPVHCGRGLGTTAIALLHDMNPSPLTYVENVLNRGLYAHLCKKGWRDTGKQAELPCLYRETGRTGCHGGILALF